jgi:protein-S-isoprenylcysteine O-methyltransferase Ste14
MSLLIKGFMRSLFQIGLFAALLLIPAGTWQWPRAIQFIAVMSVPLVFAPIVARIRIEETTLQETLPGYTDYMDRVPARLIPHVW